MKTAAAPMLVFAHVVAVDGATIATLRELYPDILLAASLMLCVLPTEYAHAFVDDFSCYMFLSAM